MTPARLAFPAMLTGSAALAFGPWLVRLADVAPVASAFWRLGLAVLPLAVLARLASVAAARPAQGAARPAAPGTPPTAIVAIALAGVFFASDLALWHLGIARTTLANATLMGNSASFILPAYGFIVAGTRPGRAAIAALLCAAAGIGLLLGRSADVSATHLSGDLLCVGAGAFYAAYFIAVDRARARVAPLTLHTLATLFGALALLPVAVWWTGWSPLAWWGGTGVVATAGAAGTGFWPHDWTPLVLLALGSQVIGQGLIIFAVGYLPPLVIGLTLLIQPAISATIGALRFGEGVGVAEATGMALVAAALVLVRLPSRRLASVENG